MKNSITLWFGLLFCLLGLTGCGNKPRTEPIPSQLLGRTLTLPADQWQERTRDGQDTTLALPQGLKILVYYNANGCTPCRLKQLGNWDELIAQIDTFKLRTHADVDFVFLFRSKPDNPVFAEKLQEYDFPLPVYYDPAGAFEQADVLPDNELYHTFLLDRNNKILLLGLPIFSPKLWEHYRQKITELSATETDV